MSPFTECIILATISGRALSHRHQSLVENIYVNASQDFWDRHQWINAILTQRMQILSLKYPPASQHVDPMLLFTSMVAQTTVLYLYKTMECVTPATDENRAVMMEYQRCSLMAAQEIVNLTKTLAQLSCFKVRPLDLLPWRTHTYKPNRYIHSRQSRYSYVPSSSSRTAISTTRLTCNCRISSRRCAV